MRIIIAGSRSYSGYYTFRQNCLDVISKLVMDNKIPTKDIEIISGGAQGADRLGESFAKEFQLKLKKFPADWNTFGKSAGYLRNEQMAKYASEDKISILLAFWDGASKGTAHMIDTARKYNIKDFIFFI